MTDRSPRGKDSGLERRCTCTDCSSRTSISTGYTGHSCPGRGVERESRVGTRRVCVPRTRGTKGHPSPPKGGEIGAQGVRGVSSISSSSPSTYCRCTYWSYTSVWCWWTSATTSSCHDCPSSWRPSCSSPSPSIPLLVPEVGGVPSRSYPQRRFGQKTGKGLCKEGQRYDGPYLYLYFPSGRHLLRSEGHTTGLSSPHLGATTK